MILMKTLTKKAIQQAKQSLSLTVSLYAVGSFSASHFAADCASRLGVRIVAHDVGLSIDILRDALRNAERESIRALAFRDSDLALAAAKVAS
jgi:hypothetical protein